MLHQARALNGLLDGDLAVVGPAAAEGARLSREAGDVYSLEMMLMNQAIAAVMSGDLRECELRSTEGLRIADQLDDRIAQCYLLGALGVLRGGPGRAPASRAAARSHGQRPRRSRGEHPRRPRSGTRPGRPGRRAAALGPASFAADFADGQHLTRQMASRLALRETAPALPCRGEPRGSAALSRRGAEVAQLVAEGLTNREIGARLFISERTVESHVRTVLNTLGFTSRAQIASWVAASR